MKDGGLLSFVIRHASFIFLVLVLSSCIFPGSAAPVVKIGLIAPFEGLQRPLGYAVLPAVKIAVAEANASSELGRYKVALTALNDDGDADTAGRQAAALAVDPDVLGVVGPWSAATAEAAAPVLSRNGIPALVAVPLAAAPSGVMPLCSPSVPAERPQVAVCSPAADLPDEFVRVYIQQTGVAPDPKAALAYAAARSMLAAIARDIAAHGQPSRTGVAAELAGVELTGAPR